MLCTLLVTFLFTVISEIEQICLTKQSCLPPQTQEQWSDRRVHFYEHPSGWRENNYGNFEWCWTDVELSVNIAASAEKKRQQTSECSLGLEYKGEDVQRKVLEAVWRFLMRSYSSSDTRCENLWKLYHPVGCPRRKAAPWTQSPQLDT